MKNRWKTTGTLATASSAKRIVASMNLSLCVLAGNFNVQERAYASTAQRNPACRGERTKLLGQKWVALWAGAEVFGCGDVKGVPIRGPLSEIAKF
jgi:hypothetical protein